jgi:RNA polymerase sigma-70 factor (ECF subfamily)
VVDEGVLFEGLRLGSRQAFTATLAAVDPTMRRLGRQYVAEDEVGDLVLQTWSVALPGLDMFTWHTTLRAWVTGIFVTYARARHTLPSTAPSPVRAGTSGTAPAGGRPAGPADVPWATLGWSALWPPERWPALEGALAARPLAEREVLWLRDVEGWSWRETLDTFGLTAAQGGRLLEDGRAALAATVGDLVGAGPVTAADRDERLGGVSTLLGALRPTHDAPPDDPALQRLFGRWRRRRGVQAWRRWHWELGRGARAR